MVMKLIISFDKLNLLFITENITPMAKHPNKLQNRIPFGPEKKMVEIRYLDSAPKAPPNDIYIRDMI